MDYDGHEKIIVHHQIKKSQFRFLWIVPDTLPAVVVGVKHLIGKLGKFSDQMLYPYTVGPLSP